MRFINKEKKFYIFVISIFISINIFVMKAYALTSLSIGEFSNMKDAISVEYIEDTKGDLNFEQIKSEAYNNRFNKHNGDMFSIGYCKNNLWYRIKVKDIDNLNDKYYFSVNNPNIEKLTLYVPLYSKENYSIMKSGCGFKNDINDIGFIYPIFKINRDVDLTKYIYVQIKSSYTQNYKFEIVNCDESDNLRQSNILFMGILFGILIAMMLYNFILFIFLKDRVCLYYVMYILMMIIYQLGMTGAVKIFKWRLGYLLQEYFGLSGIMMAIFAIIFIREFLKTKINLLWHDRFLNVSIGLLGIDILLMALGYKYEALVTSAAIISIVVLLILSTSIMSMCKKVRQARYFILAWSVMILGGIIFMLRGYGVIPQNSLTMNSLLLASAIESIFISLALADRVKILREEKENAERESKLHELAFLKAQIKPHFLYNSLNVIAALCVIEPKRARELILDLSNYLHHTFEVSNKDEDITFEEELEFIDAYVRIEKARFREKLNVEYDIDNTEGLKLPQLILQPLVENAIKHGIRKKDIGGTVIIRVKNKENNFKIEVEDSGGGMSDEAMKKLQKVEFEKGKGIGLINIKLRLKELYGTDLIIKSEVEKGTLVSFEIPKSNYVEEQRM